MVQEDVIRVDASVRTVCGTGGARALRSSGMIPAVVYGKGRDPVHVSLSQKDFLKTCRSFSVFSKLVELSIGEDREYVVTREIQRHPVNSEILHVDFQFVGENTEIKVEVPLVFLNEQKCAGVRRGGVLNLLQRSLVVRCSPSAIPKGIDVDLLNLGIGHSLHISDLELPNNVSVAMKGDDPVIVTVSAVETDSEAGVQAAESDGDAVESPSK